MKRITPAIIMVFFLLALVFWTDRPKAAELVVHGVSYHFDRSRGWNEQNLGAGLRFQHKDGYSTQIGTYRNSYFRQTWYAIGQKEWPILSAKAGVFAGKVTGYNAPLAAGLMISTNNLTFRIVPPAIPQTTGVIALEFRKAL